MDSGSKALKFLGLNEDEQRNADTNISVASESHQVEFSFNCRPFSRDQSGFIFEV